MAQKVYDRLLPYAIRHNLERDGKPSRAQAVGHALAIAEQLESAGAPQIPWPVIRSALIDQLGLVNRDRIDTALHNAGMPRE